MIYEWRCNACQVAWDERRDVIDYNKPSYCVVCGSAGEKVLHAPGVVFIGDFPGKQIRKEKYKADLGKKNLKTAGEAKRMYDADRRESWKDYEKGHNIA